MNLKQVALLSAIHKHKVDVDHFGCVILVLKRKDCKYLLEIRQDFSDGLKFRLYYEDVSHYRQFCYNYHDQSLAASAICEMTYFEVYGCSEKDIKSKAYEVLDQYIDLINDIKKVLNL